MLLKKFRCVSFCVPLRMIRFIGINALLVIIYFNFWQPEKVQFQLRLRQSKPIFYAFKAIRESSSWESLSDAQKRIVEG